MFLTVQMSGGVCVVLGSRLWGCPAWELKVFFWDYVGLKIRNPKKG